MEKLENGSTDCDRQSGSLKVRIKIRPKVNGLSIETKEDQEQQPNPSGASAVNMEELQNGGNDCDRQSRSSRFHIKIRTNVKGSSLETKEDPERQPEVKKDFEETKDDQEEQPNVNKVRGENKDDQEQKRIIGDTELHEEMKKTGALDDEEGKNFRLNEAEAKEKRKRGFTLALSREQIEDDILELLGSMPPRRRPKKRSRASQLRLKNLFPAVEELFVM